MSELFDDYLTDLAATAKPSEKTVERVEAEQKSREWFQSRLGKFTASGMIDYVTAGTKGAEFGVTAINYLAKLAVERSMTDEGIEMYLDSIMHKEFWQCQWGEKNEPVARERISEIFGVKISETSFSINPKIPYFGGSVDGVGVLTAQKKKFVTEIKCPADPLIHEKNVQMILTGGIDAKHKYYPQWQAHLMNNEDADFCLFGSFDPRRRSPKDVAFTEIYRDTSYIDWLYDRVERGEKAINDYLLLGVPISTTLNK